MKKIIRFYSIATLFLISCLSHAQNIFETTSNFHTLELNLSPHLSQQPRYTHVSMNWGLTPGWVAFFNSQGFLSGVNFFDVTNAHKTNLVYTRFERCNDLPNPSTCNDTAVPTHYTSTYVKAYGPPRTFPFKICLVTGNISCEIHYLTTHSQLTWTTPNQNAIFSATQTTNTNYARPQKTSVFSSPIAIAPNFLETSAYVASSTRIYQAMLSPQGLPVSPSLLEPTFTDITDITQSPEQLFVADAGVLRACPIENNQPVTSCPTFNPIDSSLPSIAYVTYDITTQNLWAVPENTPECIYRCPSPPKNGGGGGSGNCICMKPRKQRPIPPTGAIVSTQNQIFIPAGQSVEHCTYTPTSPDLFCDTWQRDFGASIRAIAGPTFIDTSGELGFVIALDAASPTYGTSLLSCRIKSILSNEPECTPAVEPSVTQSIRSLNIL